MNYQKIYNQIIERAKIRMLEGYKERHHIIPKCLGGSNDKENLVELTAREHFICHQLLVEIYPDNKKLKYALCLMNIGKRKNKNADYNISSRTYERLKKEHSKLMKNNKNNIGRIQTQETKDKISKANSKPKPIGFGKKSEEFKMKISKSWDNRIVTWGDKISKGSKGVSRGKGIKKPNSDKKREIIQLDFNNQIIKEWNSITDACLFLNKLKGAGAITLCCQGKYKTAYGYKWKYK
jgi:hypothetical protein